MKLPPQTLASVALLLALVTSAGAQQEGSLRGRDGDEVRAQAANRAAQARMKNLCISFNPIEGETNTRRTNYPEWVKQLICRYMVADFTTAAARNAYVERVLTALRAKSKGAWRFANRAPVAHIVTQDPAYVYQSDPDKPGVVKEIKESSIRRSLVSPASSAIGINQKLFVIPPARTRTQANRRIRKSEDVIQQILMLAIVADMIAGTKNSISKTKISLRIKAGLKYFQQSTLTAAKILKISGTGIGPQSTANDARRAVDNYRPPEFSVAKNVLERAPGARDKSIKITKIKPGKPLGLTRSLTGFATSIKSKETNPTADESIEPKYEFKKYWLLKATIRTFIVVETFFGVPRSKKGKPQNRNVVRVMGLKGKDCTPAIKKHETKHVEQFWKAWREQVLLPIRKDLEDREFKEMKAKSLRVFATPNEVRILDTNKNVVYLDFAGFYAFLKTTKSRDAKNILKEAYNEKSQMKMRGRFLKSVDKMSDLYHKKEVGLDDNCKPVKDAKLAKASLGKLGKSEEKKPKKIKKKYSRRSR